MDVNNNDNNDNNDNNGTARVLRLQTQTHLQKYSQGTRVYRIFGEIDRLKEHQGYVCDFDEKEGYYKVKYEIVIPGNLMKMK